MEHIKTLEKTKNFEGNDRRLGLEIEYVGLPLADSAKIISDVLSCPAEPTHKTHYTFNHPQLGEFVLELDVELAKKISQKAKDTPDSEFSVDKAIDSFFPEMISGIAPSELVTSPLEVKNLKIVSDIVIALRKAGAKGTSESFMFAFGYHVNPEVKSTNPAEILPVLQSFTLLFDFLVDHLEMDITRKLSGYAAPYPKSYARLILDEDYSPDIDTLMTDYITHAPSRNYALDMLPLFKFIDEGFITEKCPDSLIKKRPTYHFRLPNCKINEDTWDIYKGINAWSLVEVVASDKTLLKRLSADYLKIMDSLIDPLTSRWRGHVKNSLEIKGLV